MRVVSIQAQVTSSRSSLTARVRPAAAEMHEGETPIADSVQLQAPGNSPAPRPTRSAASPAAVPVTLIMEPAGGLESNLQIAHAALDYVRSLGIRSSNRGPLGYEERRAVDRILEQQVREEIRQGEAPRDAGEVIRRYADAARRHRAGNCGEKSRVAFGYLQDVQGFSNVVVISGRSRIHDQDGMPVPHEFLALGLDPAADIARPESWGPNAVILDPWQDFALPVDEGMKYIQGYFDTGYGIDFTLSDGIRDLIPGPDKAADPLLWENLRKRPRRQCCVL
ncbi:MAG: hypothetical protein HY319_23015 [Armatimonadetes bacterium]|nr:hypothetical protein [Armatimonadota bacterium]